MKFRYSARTKTGELQVGNVEAVDKDTATSVLISHDLFVLSIDKYSDPKWYNEFFLFWKSVKSKDLAIFTRQFSAMLGAKISLTDSLNSLYYQTQNTVLKEALYEIAQDITSGLSLSQALQKHGNIFFDFYVNLVQSAEVTGRLEEVMEYLANYLEKELLLSSKVKTAMIYPVFVITLSLIVGAVLVGLVFPQIKPIFTEANFELPLITRIFLNLGDFINEWWAGIIIFSIVFLIIILDYFRSKEGKAILNQIVLSVPGLGGLFKKLYIARFSEVSSVLIKGGIPITQSLEIAGHTIGSELYEEVIHEIVERLRRGEPLSQAFQLYGKYFPTIVTQMISVGEQTGKLEEMFQKINSFYSREVDNLVSNVSELIQPVIMVFLGLMVGFMFAALLLPIYNLIQVIR
ncbi:MAG: type II secretion system F family protein [Candidatus Pacebacteria bacterium]|nr:type II secretion system F family protein [Candidatus Paceibacterota bacterium]